MGPSLVNGRAMIMSELVGGLGNQMFQYAAGRALALRHGVNLLLDTSAFTTYTLHQGFELARVFTGEFSVASEDDLQAMLGWRRSPRIRQLLHRLAPSLFTSRRVVREPGFAYWPGFKDLPTHCYLSGYWQSEQYFLGIQDRIRADFSFRDSLTGLNLEMARNIESTAAVSLHVRRGDYASNPVTTATHGLCSPGYYSAAIGLVRERVADPHLFVFSDDLAWVKKNLPIGLPHTFVDHNAGAASYNDMRLMSLCQHHIIANSSFSWWGAWLNPRSDKIVVAPRAWFAVPVDTSDLIPPRWVTL